jgi:myo-inositol-1(or 4)-monophosphatase
MAFLSMNRNLMVNLEKLAQHVIDLTRETGQYLMKEVATISRMDVQTKGLHNFVTHVDKTSEKMLVGRLSNLLPGCGFIAEEDDQLKPAEYTWVIDPLDGTTNFIHGVPLYCISIGLMYRGETILAVVLEPNLNECFFTWKEAPTFKNGEVVTVSQSLSLGESLFATGFPYYDYNRLDEYLQIFRYLLKNSRGARRLGSAAADLAYVACGRYDGFYEYGLSSWDVCAGALLVKNAGGMVSDFKGKSNFIFGKQIIATNSLIFNEFLQLFRTWDEKES